MKKIMLLFACISFMSASIAETCPSVVDIKKHGLVGWTVYDSIDGAVLNTHRHNDFVKHVDQFALAEWTNDHHKQHIHCYYRDTSGSDLEAYLSKDNFKPSHINHYWYTVSGALQCAAGYSNCDFEQTLLHQTRLARK